MIKDERKSARRKKTLEQIKSIQTKYKKIKSKQNQSKNEGKENKMWGDKLTYSENWPNKTENNNYRIIGQNVNGFSYFNDYLEWEMALCYCDEYQADTICFTEPNLDLTKSEVKYELNSKAKNIDKYLKMQTSSSRTTYNNSNFKMGGTITATRGNWSGRIVEQGMDKYQRWTYQVLAGKNERKIMIITAYRVGDRNNGLCTIRIQQEKDLYKDKGAKIDPRESILQDLEIEIQKRHEKGYQIIFFCDMNDDVSTSSRVNKFLNNANLINIMTTKHQQRLPNTYDRGTKCIDLFAMSKNIERSAVKRCGILPFYDKIPSDHRALYVDLDTNYFFSNVHLDTTKSTFKTFSTCRIKPCDKYLQHYETYLETSRILQKIDDLEDEMYEHIKDNNKDEEELINKCRKLFTQNR